MAKECLTREVYEKSLIKEDLRKLHSILDEISKIKEFLTTDTFENQFALSNIRIMNKKAMHNVFSDESAAGLRRSFFIMRFSKIAHLSKQLSVKENSIKNNNKDIPWESIEAVSDIFYNIELLEFTGKAVEILCDDLEELESRITTIIEKELSQDIDGILKDDIEEKIQKIESQKRNRELVKLGNEIGVEIDPDLASVAELGTDAKENDREVKPTQATDQHHKVLKKFQLVTEIFIDKKKLEHFLKVAKHFKDFNENTINGRMAILNSLQILGDLAKTFSDNLKLQLQNFPIKYLKDIRNTLAHRWDSSQNANSLLDLLKTNPENIFHEIKRQLNFSEIQINLDNLNKRLSSRQGDLLDDLKNENVSSTNEKITFFPNFNSVIKNHKTDNKQITLNCFYKYRYVTSQLMLIKLAYQNIKGILKNKIDVDNGFSKLSIQEKLANDYEAFSVLQFNFTLIGQAIQNLRGKDEFRAIASPQLRIELDALRNIRNALMHGHEAEEVYSSNISFYSDPIEDGGVTNNPVKAYNTSIYLEGIELEIHVDSLIRYYHNIGENLRLFALLPYVADNLFTKQEIDTNESRYFEEKYKQELKKAVERMDHIACIELLEKLGVEVKIDENWNWYDSIFTAKKVLKIDDLTNNRLLTKRAEITALFDKYKISDVRIFGDIFSSYRTDLGIVVEFKNNENLEIQHARFKGELQGLIGESFTSFTTNELKASLENAAFPNLELGQALLNKEMPSFESFMDAIVLSEELKKFDEGEQEELYERIEKIVAKEDCFINFRQDGYYLLHLAITNRYLAVTNNELYLDIIKLLLENGADVSKQDAHGDPALHIAIDEENEELAELLIEYGADITEKNAHGKRPLQLAEEHDLYTIVNLIKTKDPLHKLRSNDDLIQTRFQEVQENYSSLESKIQGILQSRNDNFQSKIISNYGITI